MELLDILILNPNYFIRHDETRSLLWARSEKVTKDFFTVSFHSFIHPYHGQLLSLFDGNNTVEDVLDKSILGNKDRSGAFEFISRMVENEKNFRVNGEIEFLFPKNLLLRKKEKCVASNSLHQDYSFIKLDFQSTKLNFPLYITYMVNTICHTDCIYCYADCRVRKKRQIPLEKIEELFDEIEKHPILDFTIMGGEFFLDENWELILSRLKDLKLFPVISTKIPISEKIIEKLKALGVDKIQISLDSVNPDILSRLLKVNGEKYISDMKKAFVLLKQYGIKTKVNAVITRYNETVDELRDLLSFLSEYDIISVAVIPAGFSLYKSLDYMPSEEAVDILEKYVKEVSRDFDFHLRVADSLPKECIMGCSAVKGKYFEERSLCTGNLWQAFIMPNGDVTYCEGTMSQKDLILGNICEKTFSEVWKSGFCNHVFNKMNYRSTDCGTCKAFDECHKGKGVCWKLIIQGYGDKYIYYPDPRCPKAPPIVNRLY